MSDQTLVQGRISGGTRDHRPRITRRIFVGALAAVGATAPFAAHVRGAGGGKDDAWRMRLSTSSIHFKDRSIERACEQIAALRYEAVDIWSAYDKCPHLDDALRRLGPEGLAALLKQHGLKLCAFSVYVGGYAKYAELLGALGGGVAVRGSAPPCDAAELTGKMKSFFEGLKPLIELAEKHNSYLAIENHGHALLDSLDSLRAFVDLNPSSRLGIALAPYHLQAIDASVEKAIAICGRQLLFFYAWQKQPGTAQLPGIGPTAFEPWLKALARVNFSRYVNPFMHGHPEAAVMTAALAKSRDYLLRHKPERTPP